MSRETWRILEYLLFMERIGPKKTLFKQKMKIMFYVFPEGKYGFLIYTEEPEETVNSF